MSLDPSALRFAWTLDLNLTFIQTPDVKRVILIITKGTNGNLAITRPLVITNQKRTNHIDLRVCKNINQSELEGQILTLASEWKWDSSPR